MSRHPVMVALQQLANDGLVEIIPQVGCVAAAHSRDAIDDFYRPFGQRLTPPGEPLTPGSAGSRGAGG